MTNNTRPIQFHDHLPEIFRTGEDKGVTFLSKFLKAFESVFEELEAAIEGTPGGMLQLTFQSATDNKITVTRFNTSYMGFPVGTTVTTASRHTTLKQAIPANQTGITRIEVEDDSFAAALEMGDILCVYPGGIPDMFSPDKTPPPQFMHRPQSDFEYLTYLAGWIALPLRTDVIQYEEETNADYAARRTEWNRLFFKTAIPHNKERSTLPGMEWLLRAWLKDDMLQTTRPILTDLTRAHTDVNTIFQLPATDETELGEPATLGVNTVLGEGPPFFFVADLVTDPTVRELRNPVWLDVFQRAARFLLDAEKPAHTYYQLRVRAHTMQLAPENDMDKTSDEVYAQVGKTTLLWDAPWIYDSD